MTRTRLGVSAAVLVLVVSPGGAYAALFLTFSGTQARPGVPVIVQTGGTGALAGVPAGSRTIRVFLAPVSDVPELTSPNASPEIRSPNDARLIPLGALRVDEDGNGFLRFIVPNVSAGDYTTLIHCVPCASASAGRTLLPTGPFPGSFVVLESGDGFPVDVIALIAGGAVVLLVAAAGWTVMRRRSGGQFEQRCF